MMDPDMHDDDLIAENDPRFDAWLAKVAPSLNAPPATPRADMWAAIAAAQAPAKAGNGRVLVFRRREWMWPAVAAAALVVGVGLGRLLVVNEVPRAATQVATTGGSSPAIAPAAAAARAARPARSSAAPGDAEPSRAAAKSPASATELYRLAAAQTLGQADALLTAYRASGVAEQDPAAARQLGNWGREVLSSTRLLLDSPAGDDPTLRPLLNDLELVLVQIIRLSGAPLNDSERELIDRSLRERDLLPRIRTAVPAGVSGATSD